MSFGDPNNPYGQQPQQPPQRATPYGQAARAARHGYRSRAAPAAATAIRRSRTATRSRTAPTRRPGGPLPGMPPLASWGARFGALPARLADRDAGAVRSWRRPGTCRSPSRSRTAGTTATRRHPARRLPGTTTSGGSLTLIAPRRPAVARRFFFLVYREGATARPRQADRRHPAAARARRLDPRLRPRLRPPPPARPGHPALRPGLPLAAVGPEEADLRRQTGPLRGHQRPH